MHRVTSGAAFPNSLMFKDERSGLRGMTLAAGLKLSQHLGARTPDCRSLMRIVAISATDFSFQDWMMIGQVKLSSLVQVALKADLR
jgi:hypothetical protein